MEILKLIDYVGKLQKARHMCVPTVHAKIISKIENTRKTVNLPEIELISI